MDSKLPVNKSTDDKDAKDVKKQPNTPSKNNDDNQNKRDNRGGSNRGRGDRGRGGRGPNMPGRGRGGRGGGNSRDQQDFYQQKSNQGFNDFQNQSESMFIEEQETTKVKKKFTGRCRLFVGNITPETTEEQFQEMFKPFGEIGEVFVNGSKGFGFIRLDYRHNAEAAKAALDGTNQNGRTVRIRFANHGAAVKVKNLSPYVSNELLEQAFSQFGEVERAIVVTDDRGRSLGEGIVEFARKPAVQQCMRRINEGVLLMSSYPRPVTVEIIEPRDDEDGLQEKYLPRNDLVRRDREKEPRFAPVGSFEYRFAMKYRDIDDLEKQQIERVKQEMEQQRIKLESEMEASIYDYQAEQIRADLIRQQEELRRLEEMKSEQIRRRQEMESRREDDLRMLREDEERRREMMMRANSGRGMDQPRSMSMRQENPHPEGPRGTSSSLPPPPAPPAALGFDSPSEGFGGGPPSNPEDKMGRFDSPSGGFGGSGGGFGSRGQGALPGAGQGGMYGNRGMGRGPGDAGMDRRRQAGGPGPRDDYEMKRMRRF